MSTPAAAAKPAIECSRCGMWSADTHKNTLLGASCNLNAESYLLRRAVQRTPAARLLMRGVRRIAASGFRS